MNKNKHTPGPWHYTNQLIFKDGICIAETFSRETGMDAVANAQLIATAPDLLRNLKYCVDFISGKSSTTEQDKDEVLELAKTAIALAEKGGE